MADQAVSSLLVLVVDTNPVWWGSRNQDSQLQLSECLDAALMFANSHLMLSHNNKLAVIAAHTDRSHFLYPMRQEQNHPETDSGDASSRRRDGKYELFVQVDEIVKREMKQLVLKKLRCGRNKATAMIQHLAQSTKLSLTSRIKSGPFTLSTDGSNDAEAKQFPQVIRSIDEDTGLVASELLSIPTCQGSATDLEGEVSPDSVVAGALAMALCYIHRLEKERAIGQKLSSRILVLKGAEDNPSQYMNFMNAVFTSQKQNVVIDACVLDNDSGLLQQACDITGGIYLKVPQEMALLQYMSWLFLPDPSIRSKLTLPPRSQVDYRAACFCHRHLIDVGYVCSVCLSIFCMFSPICSTCQTTFKILGPPKAARKKFKKSN